MGDTTLLKVKIPANNIQSNQSKCINAEGPVAGPYPGFFNRGVDSRGVPPFSLPFPLFPPLPFYPLPLPFPPPSLPPFS